MNQPPEVKSSPVELRLLQSELDWQLVLRPSPDVGNSSRLPRSPAEVNQKEADAGTAVAAVDPQQPQALSLPSFLSPRPPTLPLLTTRILADYASLSALYPTYLSPSRGLRLLLFLRGERLGLRQGPCRFAGLRTAQEKVDYLLLDTWLLRQEARVKEDMRRVWETEPLLMARGEGSGEGWGKDVAMMIEDAKVRGRPMDAKIVAGTVTSLAKEVDRVRERVEKGDFTPGSDKSRCDGGSQTKSIDPPTASWAVSTIQGLSRELATYARLYHSYDPLYDFWAAQPVLDLLAAMDKLAETITNVLINKDSGPDTITGVPLGKEALLAELNAEMIAYTPEELIELAERAYDGYLKRMVDACERLGFPTTEDNPDGWKAGLAFTKTSGSLEPGTQLDFVRGLVQEGIDFARTHDLVTIPFTAAEALTARMSMLSATEQRTSPYFLGGPEIRVAAPTTDGMGFEQKIQSMHANNRFFSRATAFHEMVPGHGLQMWMMERANPSTGHRRTLAMATPEGVWRDGVGETAFFVEGWATYCETVFWDEGFFTTDAKGDPRAEIGSLFWLMHRCMRVVFSLRFHLGTFTPAECVRLLVERVGHEPDAAAAEVRRSLSGEYGPLYQCGYLLGAWQLRRLEEEVVAAALAVAEGEMDAETQKAYVRATKKAFRDRVIEEGPIPIEMLRALLGVGEELSEDWSPRWRFAD